MDECERKALADIEAYGCHVINVFEEDEMPPFTYSVGIGKSCGAPEIIVIGLKRELAHSIVNDYNRRAKSGERFVDGQMTSGFLVGFDCLFREVEQKNYHEYMGWNIWLYSGLSFKVLQLIYPSTSGIWPWDTEASAWLRARQPLLCASAVQ